MRVVLGLCLLYGVCAYATDRAPRLGADKSVVGGILAVAPRTPAISNVAPLQLAADPLDTERLHRGLSAVQPEIAIRTRGAREVQLYARMSPSVVLILGNDGFGSGSLISDDGRILTNWHVVGNATEVGVVFKPSIEGRKLTRADVRRARVLRVDEVADLALLKVDSPPSGVKSVVLGNIAEAQIGADVHAIGHPTGESWTYTKGIISQLRKEYEWITESGVRHQADVIQTQTPINPGNSGGPLLGDDGKLLGVNSFKAQGEALNFAVTVGEVRRFLSETVSRRAQPASGSGGATAPGSSCEAKVLQRGRNKRNDSDITLIDITCDGAWDLVYLVPDDVSDPILLMIDSKNTGKIDVIVFDTNRDGKWDFSHHDTDGDGAPNLVGYHPDGAVKASRFERYVARR
jgi:S1-C subfamily serine protease